MSMIVFDGVTFAGERVAIEATKIVAAVTATPEEGKPESRTVIMFRSGDTDHRAIVAHTVEEVSEAYNKVMGGF